MNDFLIWVCVYFSRNIPLINSITGKYLDVVSRRELITIEDIINDVKLTGLSIWGGVTDFWPLNINHG